MYNQNALDRGIRVLFGILIVSLFFLGPRTAWGLLGFIPLLTGLVGFCPAYRLFSFSSRKTSHPAP